MKILMVCLGNICRSPMAEGILRNKAQKAGKNYHIDSAGTSGYHIGEAPDKRAIEKMKKYHIDISALRARQFTVEDFDRFDLILAMDTSNYQNILRLASNEHQKQKVKLIMNYVYPNENLSVPDPYYGGDDGFEKVYEMLCLASDKIIEQYP
jgi:protein-tyrosine phosphatase